MHVAACAQHCRLTRVPLLCCGPSTNPQSQSVGATLVTASQLVSTQTLMSECVLF